MCIRDRSTTLRALGKRPGAAEAAAQFDALWMALDNRQGPDVSKQQLDDLPHTSTATTIET